jgi:hypothetical protein
MVISIPLEIPVLANLIVAGGVVAIFFPNVGERWVGRLERVASRFALRRALCCALLAALVIVIRVQLLSIWHVPRPRIHDEFGYLLSAQTFAAGRLTNPSPKYYEFFQVPHILVTPTFQSRYPPGQGLVLAAGKLLFGQAWFGVLLSCAAMSAAICWMLQGWMPARWALLGGLLSLVRLSIYSYWMNSYWGGAVAAIGGCLVMGAYPRIVRRGRPKYAWAMGIGLIILANTRPLEGAISCLPVGLAIFYWLWSGDSSPWLKSREQSRRAGARLSPLAAGATRSPRFSRRARFATVAAPLAICAAACAAFIGYYDYRVTGRPLDLPHLEASRQYGHVPMLLMGRVDDRKIVYPSSDMEYQYGSWEPEAVRLSQAHYFFSRWHYAQLANHETLGLLLTFPLLMIAWTTHDRRVRLMLICLLSLGLVMSAEVWGALHYAAPQIGSFFGLLVQCIRHMRAAPRGRMRAAGRFFSRALPIASVVVFVAYGISVGRRTGWTEPLTPVQNRPEMEAKLLSGSRGKAIVFVQYRFDFQRFESFEDWNYNAPDLDTDPVLWVHDLGRSSNEKILQEFPGRAAWYCKIDYSRGPDTEPEFSPYDN